MSDSQPEPYEYLARARRKVAKWRRKADKAVAGAKAQAATIKVRYWEEQEDYWFERWSQE